VRIEDAKSYFSFTNRKYDLIISEPSNPWVSGVASLFTKEFYSRVREYLTEDGLFVQWIHLYDIDMPLVASIMKALGPYFSDYIIYATNPYDMLIVACPVGDIQEPKISFLTIESLMHELNKVDIMGLPDINVRVLGNKSMLSPLFESYGTTANSDYAPIVDLNAVKSRFFDRTASPQFHSIEFGRLPIMQMLGKQRSDSSLSPVAYSTFPKSIRIHFADMIFQYFMNDQMKWSHPYAPLRDQSRQTVMNAKQVLTRKCSEDSLRQEWWMAMLHVVADLVPCWSPEQLSRILKSIETSSCSKYLSDSQRDFIALIKAVGKEDPSLMSVYARKLLAKSREHAVDADLLEYILSAGMLGDLSGGNKQEARDLWGEYGPVLPAKNAQSFTLRLMISHLSMGQESLLNLSYHR